MDEFEDKRFVSGIGSADFAVAASGFPAVDTVLFDVDAVGPRNVHDQARNDDDLEDILFQDRSLPVPSEGDEWIVTIEVASQQFAEDYAHIASKMSVVQANLAGHRKTLLNNTVVDMNEHEREQMDAWIDGEHSQSTFVMDQVHRHRALGASKKALEAFVISRSSVLSFQIPIGVFIDAYGGYKKVEPGSDLTNLVGFDGHPVVNNG